jgi:uncharacterized protein YaiI (UPF0178 family)
MKIYVDADACPVVMTLKRRLRLCLMDLKNGKEF